MNNPCSGINQSTKAWKIALFLFAISFLVLGYLGALPPSPGRTAAAQIATVVYFGFFLAMPFYTKWEKTKPVPDRVSYTTVIVERAGEAKSAVPFGEVDKARMTAQ